MTVFICGAVVMVFELAGSRVLGPYFGTSIFVWTSLIGVILGSLSFGYYFGGKMADKQPRYSSLSLVIFLAALSIGATLLIKDTFLTFLQSSVVDIRMMAVIGSSVLFLPASVLLGMVSPYAVKLKLGSLETSGTTVGNLYALSTAGSIFGTFLSGFYLIPHFGTNKLLIILSLTLLLVSVSLSTKRSLIHKAPLFLLMVGFASMSNLNSFFLKPGVIDVDTAYNRVFIYDHEDKQTGQVAKVMGINGENHSSMFLNSDVLVNDYTKYYHLAKHFSPHFETTLMLGGAGYSYPKNFLQTYKTATMDVVEIDPMMTALAKIYFRFKEDPRLTIYHEDGRVFLNQREKKYDVIFGDAFSSHYSLPYQLTTQETVERKYDLLEEDGVVIINIISAIEGAKGKFLRAEYATYRSIFPQVYLFPVNDMKSGDRVQNVMLVALKSKKEVSLVDSDPVLDEYLSHRWKKDITMDTPILTDDFAPVDYYISQAL